MLYPLKFTPIFKEKIWGGNKLKNILNKDIPNDTTGESWEISAIQDNLSVVSEGFLKDNNIEELIEVYMDELVGEKTYNKFGVEFPLLIKLINAKEDLSIQVHPDDNFAKEKHRAYGKNEMWYIIDAEKDAKITIGFNKETNIEEFTDNVKNETVCNLLNVESVNNGDVYFVPSGKIHTIGKGILLAEIQQTSDISYRIFDYNRTDKNGNLRELHNDLAKDVLNYSFEKKHKTDYILSDNNSTNLTTCPYFTSNIISFDKELERDYFSLDSFVIYICLEGEFYIDYQKDEKVKVQKGETILVPACLKIIVLYPTCKTKILETYID